ncbi:type IX secretion system membrane protein PorP/SprF [Bizionia paragorgiae]|jgi:type IX secretion system PorP/SprF family membrane protein|uniref:PorP/SprF family type IX secretion system membrane protein n=1 Tax=Bizionia paragorgiae TaxID=283786 RepID=UPI00299DAA82|nr:type IX secretion system membrane protein PorP/SprF [Bizionia paragorgiae]MDX1271353.1 type IX secretion system membrane protein PorP/SprF [Bizionia paragorgiae]
MKNRLLIIVLLTSLSFLSETKAQQDAQYTQYMYNTMSVNPAYAGQRETFSALLLHRAQWVGLEGAPRTQTLNVHAPLDYDGRLGLGVSIINDEIGPTKETHFDIDFSYTIHTSYDGRFSFGLKAGGHLMDVDYNKLNKYNPNDVLLQYNIENKFEPNVGVGFYYRNGDRWYVGLSAPNLLETDHFGNNDDQIYSVASEQIHYYLIGGYVFDVNPDLKLKPAVLFKGVQGAPLQADVSVNALLKDKLTLGVAYRWSAAFSGLLGYQLTPDLMLGVAYDREVTDLGKTKYEKGSFEFFLRFELFKNSKILSPRFF